MTEIGNRWLPPSPHREAVLEQIEKARCHLEERGHGVAPLAVFEDGGVMELPRVRFDPKRRGFYQAEEGVGTGRQTAHCDVCGTIDELKALLQANPKLEKPQLDRALLLLDDACYMIGRMERRHQAYDRFGSALAALTERLRAVVYPDPLVAPTKADEIRKAIQAMPEGHAAQVPRLHELAETIRDVANHQEQAMRVQKGLAIEAARLYGDIRGARNWKTR